MHIMENTLFEELSRCLINRERSSPPTSFTVTQSGVTETIKGHVIYVGTDYAVIKADERSSDNLPEPPFLKTLVIFKDGRNTSKTVSLSHINTTAT